MSILEHVFSEFRGLLMWIIMWVYAYNLYVWLIFVSSGIRSWLDGISQINLYDIHSVKIYMTRVTLRYDPKELNTSERFILMLQ